MTLKGWIRVTRPPLTFLGFYATIATLSLVKAEFNLMYVLAVLIIGLGNMGFCMVNEAVDIKTDRIIKKWKPIPLGQVGYYEVLNASAVVLTVTFALAVGVSTFTNSWLAFIIILAEFLACYVYNTRGKELGVLGNVSLFFAYALPIMYILQLYEKLLDFIYFPIAFGLFTFAFNTAVQYQDIPSDSKVGLKTAAMQLGRYSFIAVFLTALVSTLCFLYSNLPLYTTSLFTVTNFFVGLAGAMLIFPPEGKTVQENVEWLCRRVGRVLLIVSFTLLILRL